jgi:hypothetical protein
MDNIRCETNYHQQTENAFAIWMQRTANEKDMLMFVIRPQCTEHHHD